MRRPVTEILIIVVGVLIALGVDSWNDRRIDRDLEAEYLGRLRDELQWNVERAADIAAGLSRKLSLLTQIAEISGNPQSHQVSSGSVVAALGSGVEFGWTMPSFRVGTFEELRSTGNLGLIRNVELRAALGDYDLDLKEALERIQARRTDFPRFVYTLIPSGQLYESFSIDMSAIPNRDIEAEMSIELVEALQSQEFRRLLNAELNYTTFAKAAIEDLESRIEEVLGSVQQEAAN